MLTVLSLDKEVQGGSLPTAPCSLGTPDSLMQSHGRKL